MISSCNFLTEANTFVNDIEKCQALKVSCREGVAYRNSQIIEKRICEIDRPMLKSQYGQYLQKVITKM